MNTWLGKIAQPDTFADYYRIANWLRWAMVSGLWVRVGISYAEAGQNTGRLAILIVTTVLLTIHIIYTFALNRSVSPNATSVKEKILVQHCWADALAIAVSHIASLRTDSDQHLGLAIPLLAAALFSRFDLTVKILLIILSVGIVFPVSMISLLLHQYPELAKPKPQYIDIWHVVVCNLIPRIAFWCIAEVPIWWLIHRNHRLTEEAQVFQVLADHVDFAVFRKNIDRQFVYANKVLARQLGTNPESLLGKTDAELGMKAADEYRESDNKILVDKEQFVNRLESNYARDPKIPKIRTVKVRLDNDAGVMGLVGICDGNITREEVLFYQQSLEQIRHAMFQKDRNGRFVWVNDRFAEILCLPKNQIIGRTDEEVGYPEELAKWYRKCDSVVIEEGKILDLEEEHFFNNLREKRWVRVQKSQARDGLGDVIGIFGMFWDVHVSREEDDHIRSWFATRGNNPLLFLRQEVLNKLRAKFEAIAQLLDASGPGLSAEEVEKRRAAKAYLFDPIFQSLDLGTYATDLLFAQFDALAIFRVGATPEALVWKDFTKDAKATLREQANLFEYLWHEVEFDLQINSQGPALADQRKLIAVFWILVTNAIRAENERKRGVNESGPIIQIKFTTTPDEFELKVVDQGIGFTMEEKAAIEGGRLFKFAKSSHCGLRLLRRIAALTGGDISLESPGPNQGATFTFRWQVGAENSPSRV